MKKLSTIIIVLIIILLLLGVTSFLLPENHWLGDYIKGSFTEILGIIITLIFVERIISAQQKKDERIEEIGQLKRLDKILSPELKKSIQYASFMTQRPEPEDSSGYVVSKNFEFNRLERFYIPSLIVFDGEKAYKLFSKSIENIIVTIREALINYDFRYFPKIEKLLLEYIDFISLGTPFGMLEILEHNPNTQKMMSKMIKEIPANKVPTHEEYPHNMMRSFIRLYHVINFHIDFSERYSKEIRNVYS